MPIRLNTIKKGVFFEGADFTVSAFRYNTVALIAWAIFSKKNHAARSCPKKAAALGVPPGPLCGRLVAGEAVTLDDGRTITPEMVMGEVRRGTRLAALGDLGETASLVDTLQDVDGLVIESTYLDEEADMARQFGHLTARQAAELAVK